MWIRVICNLNFDSNESQNLEYRVKRYIDDLNHTVRINRSIVLQRLCRNSSKISTTSSRTESTNRLTKLHFDLRKQSQRTILVKLASHRLPFSQNYQEIRRSWCILMLFSRSLIIAYHDKTTNSFATDCLHVVSQLRLTRQKRSLSLACYRAIQTILETPANTPTDLRRSENFISSTQWLCSLLTFDRSS